MPELLRMASGQRVPAAFFRVSKSSVLILTFTCTVRLPLVSIYLLSLLLYSFLATILLVLLVPNDEASEEYMQAEESTQLTQVPSKPTCTQIFNTGTCADLWKNYRQALAQREREEAQLYVNRQKELASAAATAPLQQQIADLQKLVGDQQGQIKNLQQKMQEQTQADSAAAEQGKAVAHSQGLQQGAGIGVAASLVLYGLIYGVKKLSGRTGSSKPQARAAASAS